MYQHSQRAIPKSTRNRSVHFNYNFNDLFFHVFCVFKFFFFFFISNFVFITKLRRESIKNKSMSIDFKIVHILHNFIFVYVVFILPCQQQLDCVWLCMTLHCILFLKNHSEIRPEVQNNLEIKQMISDCSLCFRNFSSIRLYQKRSSDKKNIRFAENVN